MLYTIYNELLTISISTMGAELQSIKDKKDEYEYLWQGDERFWTGRAPILFPIVGGLKNKIYTYKGKKYSMPNHGFARISEFSAQYISDQEVCFTLIDKKHTREQYPFEFRLDVFYKVDNNSLIITHKITNNSEDDMPFAFGLHPAFNLADTLENTFVEMELDERLFSTVDTEDGFIVSKEKDYGQHTLHLQHDSFEHNNTIIFENLQSRSAKLYFKNSTRAIRVEWTDSLPILAFWAKKDAPYICIEPWCSWADCKDDTINDICNKKGIISLAPYDMKEISYTISFENDIYGIF